MSIEQEAVTLFYCYAHEDTALCTELETHLAYFKRQGQISNWSDRRIRAGQRWRQEIETHLTSANIILLLISPDFIQSDTCDARMEHAFAMAKAGQAQVVLVIVRPTIWEPPQHSRIVLLPESGQPITTWDNRDEGFTQVALNIGNLVRGLLSLPALPTTGFFSGSAEKLLDATQAEQSVGLAFVPRNPYKGLLPFTRKDVASFFGREDLISEILDKLHSQLSAAQQSEEPPLLTIFGPSGSGKSSMAMAGLLPSLQGGALSESERWIYLEPMVPGARPLESLVRVLAPRFPQRSLTSLQEDLSGTEARGLHQLVETLTNAEVPLVVLYIDQFEELFTQTLEQSERDHFVRLLITAITEARGNLLTILSLRADFLDRPMNQAPGLFRLMQRAQIPVLPLDHRALRDIIKKPAALPDVQLRFEDDLVGELLLEMHGQSGALPLLQFTLDRLFQQRQGQTLTLDAYHEMGGVKGALIQHAETTYATLPGDAHRAMTRVLFLSLIEPGELDQDYARRRAVLSELRLAEPEQTALLEKVAQAFTTARILTMTIREEQAIIEVSHEAVIHGWPRLAGWLREAYEDLYLRKRIREDATAWHKHGHSPTRLYHGDQLEEALRWKERSLLNGEEEEFLQSSQLEEKRQQSLNQQQNIRQQRRYRRRNVTIGLTGLGLAAAAAVTTGLIFHSNLSSPTPAPASPYIYRENTDAVYSVSWLQNGRSLASGSADKVLRIWDVASGRSLYRCVGHTDTIYSVAWSPDGLHLVSGSADRSIRIWESTHGLQQLLCTGHTDSVYSVAWSPDGQRLASASGDRSIRVWDASNGTVLFLCLGHTDNVYSVSWSPDGKRLASASGDQSIRVWDASNGHLLYKSTGHTDTVYSVSWSPDGQRLASASGDQTVRIWSASSGQQLILCAGHTDTVYSVAWSPHGKRLASASDDRSIRTWDTASGTPISHYRGHTATIECVIWSPDGNHLASASDDRSVRIWNSASKPGNDLLAYTGHTATVECVSWSPDGVYLASSSDDKVVQIWNASDGDTLLTYTGHKSVVETTGWSPEGHRMASASQDGAVREWKVASGRLLFRYTGHKGAVYGVAWAPDRQRIASASDDGTVRIWDTVKGEPLLTYTGHTGGVQSVTWSPDSTRIASAGFDQSVQIWDAADGKQRFRCAGHTSMVDSVAWSPDGKRIASASHDHSVRIWDASNGTPLLNYTGHTAAVECVTWSPDSKYVASASDDKTVQIWDTVNGHLSLLYTGHTEAVYSVSWSPEGQRLASASADLIVRVWLWMSD